jgi:hypothetical protein
MRLNRLIMLNFLLNFGRKFKNEIAAGYDYQFTGTELQSFLEKMPNKDLASAVNPGIGNRLHLNPR